MPDPAEHTASCTVCLPRLRYSRLCVWLMTMYGPPGTCASIALPSLPFSVRSRATSAPSFAAAGGSPVRGAGKPP